MTPALPSGTTTPTDAGREKDALIAEKVMGESLSVPREQAMVRVGFTFVRVTGSVFVLDVMGRRVELPMPLSSAIGGHESDRDTNDRYYRYVAAHLLTMGAQVAPHVERLIAAFRLTPKPYSTEIAAAWLVVEKLRRDGWTFGLNISDELGESVAHIARFQRSLDADADYECADTSPLAICKAALAALDAPHV